MPPKAKVKALRELYQQGRFEEAFEACEQLLKSNGPSYDILV